MGIKNLFHVVSLFKPDFNEPIFYKVKPKNFLIKYFFYLLGLLGRIPTSWFKSLFKYEINERIVEVPFVFQNLNLEKGQEVLDFGCNESKLSMELASLGYKVTGIDLNDYHFQHRNFTFIKGDFLQNNFEEESFDAVVALSSVEHAGLKSCNSPPFPKGDHKVLDEIFRILKNGGVLLLTVPFARKYYEDDFQRAYDNAALYNLTHRFKVIKEEYFVRNDEKSEWIPCGKEEASQVAYIKERGVDAVACLVCSKDL